MTYIFILYYFFGSLKMTKTCISQRGLGHKVSHGFQRIVNLLRESFHMGMYSKYSVM